MKTTPKPISSLVFFIEAHHACAVESYNGPKAPTMVVSSEVRQPDGTVERVKETIPATVKAVREWLGY